jgi:hypothetical protein
MTEQRASGHFVVDLTPSDAAPADIGALMIAKTFHGDLNATSAGMMLAVRTAVDGSAGYVAMERVTGTLGGHQGSFALQHSGVMTRGTPQLSVAVVPDSGTAALTGLTGTMAIIITPGRHDYVFSYTLPAA